MSSSSWVLLTCGRIKSGALLHLVFGCTRSQRISAPHTRAYLLCLHPWRLHGADNAALLKLQLVRLSSHVTVQPRAAGTRDLLHCVFGLARSAGLQARRDSRACLL